MTILKSPQRVDPDAWDTLVLDDLETAGLARVTVKRSNKWEKKKFPGKNGEDLDFKGVESATIKIELECWEEGDYEVNKDLLKAIDPIPGKKGTPKTISIVHAVTAARNIGWCAIDSIEGPTQDGEKTRWTIEAIERLAPTPAKTGGGPALKSATCPEMLADYQILREDFLQAKYSTQFKVADLRNQQEQASGAFGNDDARVLELERQIQAANQAVKDKFYYLELLRQKMMLKGCPNVPPGDLALGVP